MKCYETFRSADYSWGFHYWYQHSLKLHPLFKKNSIDIQTECINSFSVKILQPMDARNSRNRWEKRQEARVTFSWKLCQSSSPMTSKLTPDLSNVTKRGVRGKQSWALRCGCVCQAKRWHTQWNAAHMSVLMVYLYVCISASYLHLALSHGAQRSLIQQSLLGMWMFFRLCNTYIS